MLACNWINSQNCIIYFGDNWEVGSLKMNIQDSVIHSNSSFKIFNYFLLTNYINTGGGEVGRGMALGNMYNILETMTKFTRKNSWKLLQSYQKCQLLWCPGRNGIYHFLLKKRFLLAYKWGKTASSGPSEWGFG